MSSFSRVTRAERLLNMMVSKDQLSETGKDFLVAAVDPMHDTQLKNLEGWPDVETSGSIVRCIKQSVPISTKFANTNNFDCMVYLWPWLTNIGFTLHTRTNNFLDAPGVSSSHLFGGVQVWQTQTDFTDIGSANQYLAGSVTLDPVYSPGATRVIGLGIEVVNTTSELYKQGQCTVFRLSQSHSTSSTFTQQGMGTSWSNFTMDGAFMRRPPQSLKEAMLIPGSRTWEAKDGAYVVAPFVGQDNPPCMVDYVQPIIYASTSGEDVVQTGTPATWANTSNLYAPEFFTINTNNPGVLVPFRIYDLHSPGVYFSGLSAQTTLTLTVNIYLESFPTPAEPDVLVLATPSAEYDPVALELFSRALGSLPVGVPAGMNGLGDWFAGAVADMAKVASPIATATLGPMAGAAVNAVGGLANAYRAPPTPQSIPRVKNVPKTQPRKLPVKQPVPKKKQNKTKKKSK